MHKQFTKESLRRALRTFIQTALSYIAVNICVVDFTATSEVIKSTLLGVVVSAIAAGLAAIMNREQKQVEEFVEDLVDALDEEAE